jgi:hypothetical protein
MTSTSTYWAAGASYTVGNLTMDGRLLKIVDDPESHVISADLDERILGAGFALKLGEGFKVSGEVSSWSTSDPHDPVTPGATIDTAVARGVFADGKARNPQPQRLLRAD